MSIQTPIDPTTNEIYEMLRGDYLPAHLENRRRHEEACRKFRGDPGTYFKEKHTRELISIRRQVTRGSYVWIDGIGDVSVEAGSRIDVALRMELATRPHVPNKPEAKAIRQAKASQSRGQSKGKNR